MKASLLATLAATLLLPSVKTWAQPEPTPYVETTTITLYWGLSSTYITTPASPVPTVPDVGTTDPETLPEDDYFHTDTGTVRAYTGPAVGSFAPVGGQQFLMDRLLQRLVRDGKISKQSLGNRWQLIGVREAPRNVKELATNPYRIFLSSGGGSAFNVLVDPYGPEEMEDDLLAGNSPLPSDQTFDTGMTITLGQSTGAFTERDFKDGIVTNASGSVTTAFVLNYGARFYEDPLHDASGDDPAPTSYHQRRDLWQAEASGLINYKIRAIRGEFPTFIATSVKATGTGWFTHRHTEIKSTEEEGEEGEDPTYKVEVERFPATFSGSGLAPLRVVLSTIQYQKRTNFFPPAPTDLAVTLNPGVAPTTSLSWTNVFGGNDFAQFIAIERQEVIEGVAGAWSVIETFDRFEDVQPFTDSTIEAGKTYRYRIQALGENGPSLYTAPVTIEVPAAEPPVEEPPVPEEPAT